MPKGVLFLLFSRNATYRDQDLVPNGLNEIKDYKQTHSRQTDLCDVCNF